MSHRHKKEKSKSIKGKLIAVGILTGLMALGLFFMSMSVNPSDDDGPDKNKWKIIDWKNYTSIQYGYLNSYEIESDGQIEVSIITFKGSRTYFDIDESNISPNLGMQVKVTTHSDRAICHNFNTGLNATSQSGAFNDLDHKITCNDHRKVILDAVTRDG